MDIGPDLWTLTFWLKEVGFSELDPQTVEHFLLQRELASNQGAEFAFQRQSLADFFGMVPHASEDLALVDFSHRLSPPG